MTGPAAGLVAPLMAVLLAGAAGAESPGAQTPGADYFTGIYERVGRTSGPEAALIDDLVRIVPDLAGGGVLLTVCLPEGAPGFAPMALRFDETGEVPNSLSARNAEDALDCAFYNGWDNDPVLVCQSAKGARFTLLAAPDRQDCPEAGASLPGLRL